MTTGILWTLHSMNLIMIPALPDTSILHGHMQSTDSPVVGICMPVSINQTYLPPNCFPNSPILMYHPLPMLYYLLRLPACKHIKFRDFIPDVVGKLHSVCILSQVWFGSIYSLPISNLPWHHPVGRLHTVSFLFEYTFSWLFLILPWSHPFTLQFLRIHTKITPHQNSPTRSFYFCL